MKSPRNTTDKAENLKEKKKLIRQEQMIDAAKKVFLSQGIDATNIEMITNTLGYNKRTFYLYFRDKNDIFYAVLLEPLKILYSRMSDAIVAKHTGFEKLMALARVYYAYFIENPEFFEFNRTYEARNYYYRRKPEREASEFAIKCQHQNDKISQLLLSCIKQGMKDKSIRMKIEPKKLMLILWGMGLGVMDVIIMRQKHLNDTYHTNADELFNTYLSFVEKFSAGEK